MTERSRGYKDLRPKSTDKIDEYTQSFN